MIKISVCIGSSCHLKGSYNVINGFQHVIEKNKVSDKVEIAGTFCTGHCGNDVSVLVDNEYYSVSPENIEEFFNKEIYINYKTKGCCTRCVTAFSLFTEKIIGQFNSNNTAIICVFKVDFTFVFVDYIFTYKYT